MATTLNLGYPQKINEATTNNAAGVNIGAAIAITNKASGGAIGTAAATVDIGSIFNVNQTTASQTLTIPSPTITTEYKVITVNNVGTQAFTVLSTSIATATGMILQWNGSAWSVLGGSYAAASGVFTGAVTTSSPTTAFGFATGAGDVVTQLTDKSTGVTLDTNCGSITMNNASLAGAATVSFTLTNSTIVATDVIVVSVKSGASTGLYTAAVTAVGTGSCVISVTNVGSTAGEVVVINFARIHSVAA
jgi:hypothetical protein